MQIQVHKSLVNIWGNVYRDPEGFERQIKEGKVSENDLPELKIGKPIINALLAVFPDEKTVDGEKKLKRYMIALKVKEAMDKAVLCELSVDEVKIIKDLAAKAFTTEIYALLATHFESAATQ